MRGIEQQSRGAALRIEDPEGWVEMRDETGGHNGFQKFLRFGQGLGLERSEFAPSLLNCPYGRNVAPARDLHGLFTGFGFDAGEMTGADDDR